MASDQTVKLRQLDRSSPWRCALRIFIPTLVLVWRVFSDCSLVEDVDCSYSSHYLIITTLLNLPTMANQTTCEGSACFVQNAHKTFFVTFDLGMDLDQKCFERSTMHMFIFSPTGNLLMLLGMHLKPLSMTQKHTKNIS